MLIYFTYLIIVPVEIGSKMHPGYQDSQMLNTLIQNSCQNSSQNIVT